MKLVGGPISSSNRNQRAIFFCSLSMKTDGYFTENLVSLELQLKTLFEEVGGTDALNFLDAVAKLYPSEQKSLLPLFTRIVTRFASSDLRAPSEKDLAMQKFEDDLYNDLIKEIEASRPTPQKTNLQLVEPAATKRSSDEKQPIDFLAALRARQQ